MKTILKISLLILSISLVNCKKTNPFYVVELENEPATVRKITDFPENFDLYDELYYLELVNPHPKLPNKDLIAVDMVYRDGYGNSDEIFEPYKIEGLSVKVSGVILENKKPVYENVFHYITLKSIEADE
jgi:hypothetical protein